MKLRKSHIEEEWSEGHPDEGGDGYWIALKPGWKWDGDPLGAVHSIHEDTRREARRQGVLPCQCPDCAQAALSNNDRTGPAGDRQGQTSKPALENTTP